MATYSSVFFLIIFPAECIVKLLNIYQPADLPNVVDHVQKWLSIIVPSAATDGYHMFHVHPHTCHSPIHEQQPTLQPPELEMTL